MNKIILTIFMLSFSSFAQNRMDAFGFLEGKWKLDNDKFTLIEEWTIKSDTVFQGVSYIVNEGEIEIAERLHLMKLNDHIVYIAQPGRNLPTLFTLISGENNRFIFENKEHDFPQRIIYHLVPDNILNATIEGDVNGELKKKEFNFIRLN